MQKSVIFIYRFFFDVATPVVTLEKNIILSSDEG
jgi:hypothetical protein